MKKLLAMMAAACAISAFADWSGKFTENFESYEEGAWTVPEEGWTLNGTAADFSLDIKAEESNKYLALETPNDGSLAKTITEENGWNVFVDTMVKFTAFEDTTPVIDSDAKIALWYSVKEAVGEEGQEDYTPAQTNLMVLAAALDAAGGKTTTNVALDIADFDATAWHQVKIVSLGNVAKAGKTATLGFEIYIDNAKVSAKESLIAAADQYLTAEAYAKGAELFPCVTTDTTIGAVAFRGNGSIDDLTIDATQGAIQVIAPTSDYWTATAAPAEAAPGAKITLTLTAEKGYLFADGTSEKVVVGTLKADGTVEFEEPATAEIVARVDENEFISLKAAFDSIDYPTDETEIDIVADCQYEGDGFELKADDILVIVGEIEVNKNGIKLMTEDSTLYVEGEFDAVTSGVDGFEAKFNEEESIWYLEESAADVAKIGDQGYKTLAEAFNAAGDGDEIVMLANVTLSERIFIGSDAGDKDITLDLAGKTITWDANVDNASGVLIVCSGSKLTVGDSSSTNAGKIDANGKAYAAIAITHKTYQDDNKTASLIVNGGTLVGFYHGITGNGGRPNTYIEINGGVITATNTTDEDGNLAIFNPQQDSVVVINGGELAGLWAAIEMRGGTLTVNDGTLTATAEAYSVKPNSSGSTTMGAAVAVAQHTKKGAIAVEIKGGTLTGVKAVSVANPQENSTDNVAVTLGAATYVGDLAFSADGNATVTNDGAELDAPEGYIWGANGVLTAIALPTATVESITAEGLQAAAKYTLTDKGAGYDDWNGDFIVTFDQDIAAGAVTLKGNYGTYGWVELPGTAYTKDVGKGVMATLGTTISVAELAALDPAEFLCGITNNSVEAEVKVTVQFVITDGKTTEEIGEAFEATLPAAEPEKPQVVPEEQGTVEFRGEGENAVAVITPKQDVTKIDINPTIGFMGKYEIPATITQITGVEKSQLIIKSGAFDIAPACKLVEGAIVLDEAATVMVDEEQIPVKPVLSEATDEVKPLVVGDTTAVGVKTIPGLTYTLVRSTVLGGETTDVASQMAEGARLQLTDEFVGGKPASAFYVIKVTK